MFKRKQPDPLNAAVKGTFSSNENKLGLAARLLPLVLFVPASQLWAADTGDAPASYGPAVHQIPPTPPHIGLLPPDDDAASGGAGADADDTDGIDDEDGVFGFPVLTQNAKAYTTNVFVSNPTGSVANLVGWVDFNGDGVFDPEESAVATVPPGADNIKVKLLWPDLIGVTSDFTGDTYARFRISTSVITPFDATGTFPDGEVEDYRLTVLPDVDGDEIPDSEDPDNDNDGIDDIVEGIGNDTDGDGIQDYLDPDSDNDLIPDFVEAGSNPNNPVDSDGDGTPDYLDLDSNDDGSPDSLLITGDLDGDGITGEVEGIGDADGDGITNPFDIDTDNDTIPDFVETVNDTDGDGVPNYIDLDSDNDGIPDIVESNSAELDVAALDTDGDGRVDPGNVHGSNGLVDAVESDFDSGELNFVLADSDADGIADFIDSDSDNDQTPDLIEAGGTDVDNNGRVDDLADSDNDGIVDSVDVDFVTGAVDVDQDGIIDSADASFVDEDDTDVDGIVDSFDPDADGNGLIDSPINTDSTGGVLPDADGDSIPDFQDSVDGTNDDATNGNGDSPIVVGTPATQTPGTQIPGLDNPSNDDSGGSAGENVETGLNGVAGCSIAPDKASAFDPVLAFLALFAGSWLLIKRQSQNLRRRFQAIPIVKNKNRS